MQENRLEKVPELERILSSYSGQHKVLQDFSLTFGSDDPWEAAQNARLYQVRFRTPQEIKEEGEPLGHSASGQTLVRQLYAYRHVKQRERILTFGSQSITKILEAFGTPEQQEQLSPEGRHKTLEKRRKQMRRALLEDFVPTMEQVLEQPGLLKYVQKISERRRLKSIIKLEDLRRRVESFEDLFYGNPAFLEAEKPAYLLALDPGGSFFGWFKRKLTALPKDVRDDYTTLMHYYEEMPHREVQQLMGKLFLYAALHRPVKREAIIGGYQQDFEFLKGLPEHHPLIQKYGQPNLASISNILRRKEITLLEATKVFDAYPMQEVRREANQEYLQRYKPEFDRILHRVRPLFIKGEKWLPDSLGTSVPLERLKKSIYFATLQHEDFQVVRDMLRLQTLAMSEERFYQALPLQEFKEKADSITAIARRLRYMDDRFKEHSITVKDPEDAIFLANQWKHGLYRGKGFAVAENFAEKYGLSLDEALQRMVFHHEVKRLVWTELQQRMKRYAQYSLYSTKDMEGLESELKTVQELIPYAAVQEKAVKARQITQHRLVTKVPWLPNEHTQYLYPENLRDLEEILQLEQKLTSLDELHQGVVDKLLTSREYLQKKTFYAGSWDTFLSLREQDYAQVREEPTQTIAGVQILDVGKLAQHLAQLQKDYSAISGSWLEKTRYLVSWEAESSIKGTGRQLPEARIWHQVNEMPRGSYVQKSLVTQIEELYQQLVKSSYSLAAEVVALGLAELQQGELFDSYTAMVTGTSNKDKGRFKQRFQEFMYNNSNQNWSSYQPLSKGKLGRISLELRKYNKDFGTALSMRLTKITKK